MFPFCEILLQNSESDAIRVLYCLSRAYDLILPREKNTCIKQTWGFKKKTRKRKKESERKTSKNFDFFMLVPKERF